MSQKYDWNKVLNIKIIWNSNLHLKKFIKNDDIITTELVPSKSNGLCNSVEHAEIAIVS